MRNFFTGAFLILTVVVLFWIGMFAIAYLVANLSEAAKVILAVIGIPTIIGAAVFGSDLGKNFHDWRSNR